MPTNNKTDALHAVATVDLDAVARNWLFLKNRLAAGTDCAAVVKADAYGLGARAVAPVLYAQGCRHFFTAHLDEAIAVQKAVVAAHPAEKPEIYTLAGFYGGTPRDMAAMGIVPVLNSPGDIDAWIAAFDGKKTGKCILHVDTGMNRLGLSLADLETAVADGRFAALDVRYVISHLACSGEAGNPKNAGQLARFRAAVAKLPHTCRLSLANSGGIFLGTDYHYDMVRPGCAMYGLNPCEDGANPMQPVLRLETHILQIRDVPVGETIGYGAAAQVTRPTKCATIGIGYADGLFRSFFPRGAVYIKGIRCPVIGRISMDFCVVDVTGVTPAPQCGDCVEVIGPHQTADDIAAMAGTIGYEVLTALGNRPGRRYVTGE